MKEVAWEETRTGGFRRQQRVAQKTQIPEGSSEDRHSHGRGGVQEPEPNFGGAGQSTGSHVPGVGGSNPSPLTSGPKPKWCLEWRRRLGIPHCPYLVRDLIETPWFSLRHHRWLGSDDTRAPHDHRWWFLTFVYWGEYEDRTPDGSEILRAPCVRFRRCEYQHSVVPGPRGARTVMLTGRDRHKWAFFPGGKRIKANKYFYEHGHHPCS